MAPKKRTVAFPVSSSAILQPTIPVPLRGCYALGADFGTGGKYPRFDITPERDEQLACHCHNGDPPRASSPGAHAPAEPFCGLASRLGAKPEPRQRGQGGP